MLNNLNDQEMDAVLAGLRLLATAIKERLVIPDDGDIGSILTNSGAHAGLNADQVHELCDVLNVEPSVPTVVIEVNGGVINASRATEKVEIIILDADTEGGDTEQIMEVNGDDVYVSHLVMTDQGGIDPDYVQDILNQISGTTNPE